MELTMFIEDRNMLCINSKVILPDVTGLTSKERRKKFNEAYEMPYEKRISEFATKEQAEKIYAEIEKHPDCILSEFSTMF